MITFMIVFVHDCDDDDTVTEFSCLVDKNCNDWSYKMSYKS